jgi:hypothetical protein
MNCKPGDLAILTGGFAENLGAIVEVIEPNIEYTAEFGHQIWRVRVTGLALKVRGRFSGAERSCNHVCNALDRQLRPISGLPIDEEITDEVTA